MAHHAFGPSGAERYLQCPGALALCKKLGLTSGGGSPAAAEGTLAHSLCEQALGGEPIHPRLGHTEVIDGFKVTVDEDMIQHALAYRDYVDALGCTERWVEGSLSIALPQYDEENTDAPLFGTADFIGLERELAGEGDVLHVVDFKYGRGIPVSAEANPQLLLYALGALKKMQSTVTGTNCTEVRLHIFQPRVSREPNTFDLSVGALLQWGALADRKIAHAARLLADPERINPASDLVPGKKACHFCPAKGQCRAYGSAVLSDFTNEDGGMVTEVPPAELSAEELASVLPNLAQLRAWADAVETRALELALHGETLPGYKLVLGKKGNRAWIDEAAAAESLDALLGDDAFTRKLLSPAAVEKLLGKGSTALASLTAQKDGSPQLAPESDKRPALVVANAADGFDDLTT